MKTLRSILDIFLLTRNGKLRDTSWNCTVAMSFRTVLPSLGYTTIRGLLILMYVYRYKTSKCESVTVIFVIIATKPKMWGRCRCSQLPSQVTKNHRNHHRDHSLPNYWSLGMTYLRIWKIKYRTRYNVDSRNATRKVSSNAFVNMWDLW